MRTGDHTDTRTTQRAEKLSGNTWRPFHVLTHDRHSRQIALGNRIVHVALIPFHSEFLIQDLYRQFRVRITHGECRIVLGAGLRHHEHANAILRQGLEDSIIDTDNAHHTKTLNRDQAGIINGRDSFNNRLAGLFHLLLRDIGTRRSRVERIQDTDWNILMIDGIDGRRIDHFCAEITQLHRFRKAQPIDHVSRTDHTGIGCHKTVDIRPDLKYRCVEGGRQDRCRIIRAATAQIRHLAILATRRDKAWHQGYLWQRIEGLTDQGISRLEIHDMLIELLDCLDKLPGVEQTGVADHVRNDQRGESLTITDDRIRRL